MLFHTQHQLLLRGRIQALGDEDPHYLGPVTFADATFTFAVENGILYRIVGIGGYCPGAPHFKPPVSLWRGGVRQWYCPAMPGINNTPLWGGGYQGEGGASGIAIKIEASQYPCSFAGGPADDDEISADYNRPYLLSLIYYRERAVSDDVIINRPTITKPPVNMAQKVFRAVGRSNRRR